MTEPAPTHDAAVPAEPMRPEADVLFPQFEVRA